MKIDKNLNLVLEIEREDGTKIFAHSSPIAREVFEQYYLPLAKTFSAIYSNVGTLSGPKIASLLLRDIAKKLDMEEIVEHGLVGEIHRLTNVLLLGPSGWEALPYTVARDRDLIDSEEAAEIDNACVFFTALWQIHSKKDAKEILPGMLKHWGGHLSSSNSTEFGRSLPTSTATGHSTKRAG